MPIIVLTKKNLLIALACAAALAGGLFLWLRLREEPKAGETASAMAQVENYELNVLPMKSRELPVYGVGRSDNRIALTIDAAWDADKTPFILDTLDKYGVKATFFLCGVWVKQYPADSSPHEPHGQHRHPKGALRSGRYAPGADGQAQHPVPRALRRV